MQRIKPLKRMHAKPDGFTLLEVLIAIVIASIGLFGLSMMQGTAIQGNSFARKMTHATILAQQKLEELQSAELDPDGIETTPLSVTENPDWKVESNLDENGNASNHGIFTRSYKIEANDNDASFSRLVTVTVSWDDKNGGEDNQRSVKLTTATRGEWH